MTEQLNTQTLSEEGATENPPAGDSQVFTQEQVNQLVGKTRKEERAKYANYEKYKADSEKLAEIENANKSELEKFKERAESAEAALAAIKQAEEQMAWKKEVSEKTGVPAEVIQGNTKEDMESFAESIQKYFPQPDASRPYVSSDGFAPSNAGKKSTRKQFADAMKDVF